MKNYVVTIHGMSVVLVDTLVGGLGSPGELEVEAVGRLDGSHVALVTERNVVGRPGRRWRDR